METMIDIIDVSKSYGKGLPAVNHANLHVDKGEFVFVVGSSGSGKTTLIKLLMKELDSTSGQMIVSGERLEKMKHRRVAKYRRKLGVVFQDFRLLKDRNVYENVAFAQRVIGRPTRVIRRRVPEVLQEVGLAEKYKSFPDELSGGEQQRVALARMLLHQPEIIMLDEPFSALDGFLKDTLQLEMLELIEEYQKDVLMVSHSRDEIYRFCDNMVLLEKGSCILKGKTTDIFANPRKMEAARLTGCKNISAAEKRGSHSVYARDWDFVFETEEEVKDSIKYIGIRAHYMKPSDVPEKINSMKIVSAGYTETPFENQHLFKNAENPKSKRLWYIEEKPDLKETTEQPLPSYMVFPKKSLMLLE